jgi:hypothetical protein
MYIIKTSHEANLTQVRADLDYLLSNRCWPEWNQLGIRHRMGAEDVFLDAHGSLYDKAQERFISKESDFTEWNPLLPAYTKQLLEDLSAKENFKIGRVRFMRLMPKTGLSVHPDFEQRYHLVLTTNPYAYFGFTVQNQLESARCYHIPADGYFYRADTTKEHFVYNGGWEPRIHLVIAAT